MKETWKGIPGFPNYRVSDLGKVWSLKTNRFLKPGGTGRNGKYQFVVLMNNGKRNNRLVHRLVAAAFCDGFDEDKNEVNHVDENPANNAASNLEWCNRKHNCAHSRKKYAFISPAGAVVKVTDMKNFCDTHKLRANKMCSVHTGKRKSHKGWRVAPSVSV